MVGTVERCNEDQGEQELKQLVIFFQPFLSEVYSIETLRLFLDSSIHGGQSLCLKVFSSSRLICALVGFTFNPAKSKALNYLLLDVDQKQLLEFKCLGYIAMVAVDPDFRKKGLGRKLFSDCFIEMKSRGCEMVFLETEQSNEVMCNLLSSFNFKAQDLIENFYENGSSALRYYYFFED
ncbi:MAG: N-alpha-acetyltransferase 30, partial [Paramarteilia canceri]